MFFTQLLNLRKYAPRALAVIAILVAILETFKMLAQKLSAVEVPYEVVTEDADGATTHSHNVNAPTATLDHARLPY
jgi:uncharacterized protein YoxC